MAIDSRDKRANTLLVFVAPNPDGAWDQGDRQQVANTYRGILASGAPTTNLIAMERSLFRCVFGRLWGRMN